MVLKPASFLASALLGFYSSVILNGTETPRLVTVACCVFYSSVILNGTETKL